MATTKIEIVAPSSASAGTLVSVEVRVTSLADHTVYVSPVVTMGVEIQEGDYRTIVPGGVSLWNFTFTMVETSVLIKAESWSENIVAWHLDATASRTVKGEKGLGLGSVALVGLAAVAILVSRKRKT